VGVTGPRFGGRSDQLGIQATAYGALMVEGSWFCPSMPAQLIEVSRDLNRPDTHPNKIDKETWRNRINARRPYLLPAKGKLDDEGHQRRMCPVSAGKIQCPLKPSSLGTDPKLPLVNPVPSPVGPPRICTQTSITIAPEHGTKHWQTHPYGSAEWQKIYGTLRNSTEGMNGYAKNDSHEAIERTQSHRVRGIAAQTILLAFQLAHTNRRKINAWLDTLPDANGTPRRRKRRRTTLPLETWTPKGYLDQTPAVG
jgi:hypothetical protein